MGSERGSFLSFRLDRLRAGVKPFRVHFFSRLRSTNDQAAAMRKRGELFAPAIVLTGRQIAGRGRGSNTWWSGKGSITVTFGLPVEEHLEAHQVPLVAGLAVRDAAAEISGRDDLALKWPNDVMVDGRKLAGLLCERVQKADLVGLGMNVNVDWREVPAGLRKRIISLEEVARHPVDLTDTLVTIARHLYAALSRRGERPFAETLRRYDGYHALVSKRVTILSDSQPPLAGVVQGLDEMGRLVLKTRNGTTKIISGQVQV